MLHQSLSESLGRVQAIFTGSNFFGAELIAALDKEGQRLQALKVEGKEVYGTYIQALSKGQSVWSKLVIPLPGEDPAYMLPHSFVAAWEKSFDPRGKKIDLRHAAITVLQASLFAQGIADKEPALIQWASEIAYLSNRGKGVFEFAFEQGVKAASRSGEAGVALWLKEIHDGFYKGFHSQHKLKEESITANDIEQRFDPELKRAATAIRDVFASGFTNRKGDREKFNPAAAAALMREGVSLKSSCDYLNDLADELMETEKVWIQSTIEGTGPNPEYTLKPIQSEVWNQISKAAEASRSKGESALIWAAYALTDASIAILQASLLERHWNYDQHKIDLIRYADTIVSGLIDMDSTEEEKYGDVLKEKGMGLPRWLLAIQEIFENGCYEYEMWSRNNKQPSNRWAVTLADKKDSLD